MSFAMRSVLLAMRSRKHQGGYSVSEIFRFLGTPFLQQSGFSRTLGHFLPLFLGDQAIHVA